MRLPLRLVICTTLLSLEALGDPASELGIQTSIDLLNWSHLPADSLELTPEGKLLHFTNDPERYYRLNIRRVDGPSIGHTVPLDEVPDRIVAIAREFVNEFGTEEAGESESESDEQDFEGWEGAQLGEVAYPIYNPAIGGGESPAFYEIPVFGPNPREDYKPGPFAPNFPADPIGPCPERGCVVVSATTATEPVPSFCTAGSPQVLKLWQHAGTPNLKPVLYDAGFMVGENAAGEAVASLGNQPFKIDAEPIMKLLESGQESYGTEANEAGETGDEVSGQEPVFFESYGQFKDYYITDPILNELRARRKEAAAWEWDLQEGNLPGQEELRVNEQRLVEEDKIVSEFSFGNDGEEPQIGFYDVRIQSTGGVMLLGQKPGGEVLNLIFDDGSQTSLVVNVLPVGAGGGGACSWRSWNYWYAGSWGDQKRYQQFWNDSQMCSGGPSGCGPTAWAMSYGWWDRKGARRVMASTGSADSPSTNNDHVRACCRDVFDDVNTWCVDFLSASATNPWDMYKGYRWARDRGAGYDISTKWGAPYVSWRPRNKARDGIKADRPAIIGIGFYWHYVLAYGYKERSWKCLGVTWKKQRYFKCNMGWGGSNPQWRNGNSVWFGHKARFW